MHRYRKPPETKLETPAMHDAGVQDLTLTKQASTDLLCMISANLQRSNDRHHHPSYMLGPGVLTTQRSGTPL